MNRIFGVIPGIEIAAILMKFDADTLNEKKSYKSWVNEKQLAGTQLEPSADYNSFEIKVREEDIFYVPTSWFHAVVAMDMYIGCTLAYCWGSPWYIFGSFGNSFIRKVDADLL